MKLAAALDTLRGWWPRARSDGALPVRDRLQPTPSAAPGFGAFDRALALVALALLALGLVMVYSASIALPDSPRFARLAPTHFLTRHGFALALGLVAALLALQVPVRLWEKHASAVFVGSLALLLLVLVPGIGLEANGARRWLPLGVMNFQPSELAKLAIAMYAAGYMVRKMEVKEKLHAGGVANGGGAGHHRLAAARRARHGCVHGHRDDRARHPVPRRRRTGACSRSASACSAARSR